MVDNGVMFAPRFSWLKNKYQNLLREDHYFDILLQSDLSMFTYEGLPEGLDPVWIEKYLNVAGSIALTRTPEFYDALIPVGKDGGTSKRPKYVIAVDPARNGQIDQYGDGTHISGATHNGCSVVGDLGVDAVIIYNRDTRMPELDNMIDADQLAQIDKSTYINVLLSRIAPIYSCSNDTTKKAIDALISEVISGSVKTIVSGNIADAIKMQTGVEMLDVTQPEKIQYVQYLSQLYDVILRRHYNRRGLSVRTGTKAAQQSADEIHGLDAVSWILPLAKLKARQDGWDEFNRIFGENVSVRFSDLWAQEYEAYQLRILQQDAEAETAADEMEGGADDAQDQTDEGDPAGSDERPGSGSE